MGDGGQMGNDRVGEDRGEMTGFARLCPEYEGLHGSSWFERRKRRVARVRTQTNDEFQGFEELGQGQGQGQHLLPGIPDEVTLHHISPKLPWRTFYTLSSVSRGWKQAIRSRKVYDARVRYHSTETLVVINDFEVGDIYGCGEIRALGLYSVRENAFYRLPQIPHLERGIPWSCGCISLDGKVYVLGGRWEESNILPSNEVYVMDLAAQGPWEECQSMQYGREDFGVGVIDGKIYALGGTSEEDGPILVSEMYDPKYDTWHSIRSEIFSRFDHRVTTMGEELFIHGGGILLDLSYWTRKLDFKLTDSGVNGVSNHTDVEDFDGDHVEDEENNEDEPDYRCREADFLDVYHPGKDEWRRVQNFERYFWLYRDSVFKTQGKLHAMSMSGIDVYDVDRNSWKRRHSFILPDIERSLPYSEASLVTVAVENELLTMLNTDSQRSGTYVFRSIGFGGRKRRIVWQKVKCSFKLGFELYLCTIQL